MSKSFIIRRIFSDTQYEWMLAHLPFRLMYTQCWIDTQHKLWFPRWGYTKKQIEEAKQKGKELHNKIKWN